MCSSMKVGGRKDYVICGTKYKVGSLAQNSQEFQDAAGEAVDESWGPSSAPGLVPLLSPLVPP